MKFCRVWLFILPFLWSSEALSKENTWFSITVHKQHLLIPVKIGSRSYQAIVDTGANRSVVDDDIANILNLKSSKIISVRGSHQRKKVKLTGVFEGEVANRRFQLPPMAVVDLFYVNKQADFILGLDFLRHVKFELDYKNARMRFMDDGFITTGYERLAVNEKRRVYTVPVNVNSGLTLNFLIDTGNASYTGIHSNSLKKLDLKQHKVDSVFMRGLFDVQELDLVQIETINIGKFDIKNVTAINHPSVITDQVDGNLGMDILQHFTVIFDFSQSFVYLKALGDVSTNNVSS